MQNRFIFTGDEVADWHIDEHTKSVGRQGIAAARQTLAACKTQETTIEFLAA